MMDHSELSALAEMVAERVAERHAHACLFQEEERKAIHEFASAISDEGANRETHIIVLRIGKNVQVLTQRMAQGVVWGLIIVALVGLGLIFGRNLGWVR